VYNIRRWTVMPSGGHFAALEEPGALVDDLRAFFRDLRCRETHRLKLGFALQMAGPWAPPDNQVLIAQRAEALGYHSLWVFQRLLYPIRPQNDYPPLPGQPWPKAFERAMEPLPSLAFVAGRDPGSSRAGGGVI